MPKTEAQSFQAATGTSCTKSSRGCRIGRRDFDLNVFNLNLNLDVHRPALYSLYFPAGCFFPLTPSTLHCAHSCRDPNTTGRSSFGARHDLPPSTEGENPKVCPSGNRVLHPVLNLHRSSPRMDAPFLFLPSLRKKMIGTLDELTIWEPSVGACSTRD